MDCGGISAPVPGAPPPFPPLTMVSAGLLLSNVLSFFCCSCTATFFPFLNMLSIASIGHRGNFLKASHRSHLCRAPPPPITKTLPCKPNTWSNSCNFFRSLRSFRSLFCWVGLASAPDQQAEKLAVKRNGAWAVPIATAWKWGRKHV